MSQDIVADCLNQIMNARRARKEEIVIARHSKFLLNLLDLMKELGYVDYELKDKLKIKIKNLNECKAIKPRFNVSTSRLDKYIRRYLPSRNFGHIIISTSKGLMIHEEALEKKMGGSLIAYVF